MPDFKKIFPKYHQILDGKRLPRNKKTNLEKKIKAADKMLEDCTLCERKCHTNRKEGKVGFCKAGDKISTDLHYVYKKGDYDFLLPSYSIFFLGCTVKCAYCHNFENSQVKVKRKNITEKQLAKIIDSRSNLKNIDFIGGDPLPQLPFTLKVLKHLKNNIPIMWSSNLNNTIESTKILQDTVDIYQVTFKFGNDDCAKRICKANNYTEILKRNLDIAYHDSEVHLRHLVLPNHVECCTIPIIDYIVDKYGDTMVLDILNDFNPEWKAKKMDDLNRKVNKDEYDLVYQYAEQKGINYIILDI